MRLDRTCLPADLARGAFAGRIMTPDGPCIVGLIGGAAFDMTPWVGTMARWMECGEPGRLHPHPRRADGARPRCAAGQFGA